MIPTLYEWAGGQMAFENLTKVFYEKVLRDPLLQPIFAKMSPEHTRHVAHFISEVLGGPKLYSEGDHGSHANMIGHHLGKKLTEPMRKRWMSLLIETADEVGFPTDPEFRSALVSYLEWGSRIAVINSTITENPLKDNEPMPKWGWGEPGGPYIPKSN